MINNTNLKKILFYLIFACLLTPFVVDLHTYFPYIIGKATVFRFIIGIMLIIWSFLMFGKNRGEKSFFSKLNLLSKSVVIFGLIVFISALFGVNFYYSFFSGNERMEGILGIWYFIAFFLIIATTFDYLELEKIIKGQVLISLVYSLFALIPFLKWGYILVKPGGERLMGYTGNPSFFAAYLIFNAFFALYLYFREYSFDKKILNWWLGAFLIQSFLIFVTLTRGAMLGYLVSIVLIALAIIFLSKDKSLLILKKISIGFLILILVMVLITFGGKNTSFVKNNSILSRFASISISAPTAMSRIFSAGVAWESFLQKPLFGWGQENYEAAYVENFNPEVMKHLPEDFYFDRAHNKPMEVLACNGFIGILFYLSIFGIGLYFLNELRKKQQWFLPSLALAGCLVSYFIQNVFIFDFHESYLMFFLLLGLISVLGNLSKHEEDVCLSKNDEQDENEKIEKKDYAGQMGNYLIIIVIICAITYSTIQWVIKPYLVSKKIMKIGSYINQEQGELASQELKQALYNPAFLLDDIIIGVKKIYSSYSSKLKNEDKQEIIEALVVKAEQAVEDKPWRFGLITAKGDLETIYLQWDASYLDKAKHTAETVLTRFPHFPQAYLFASKFYLINGEIEKSIETTEKTIELNPKINTSYYLLGVAYNELGEMEERNENLIKAAELDYPFTDKSMIVSIINLLAQEKKYTVIENLYLRAIQLDPQDDSLYRGLAATYAKMQNKGKAIEYAKKAVELNPAAKEAAEEFIQLVEEEQWDLIEN